MSCRRCGGKPFHTHAGLRHWNFSHRNCCAFVDIFCVTQMPETVLKSVSVSVSWICGYFFFLLWFTNQLEKSFFPIRLFRYRLCWNRDVLLIWQLWNAPLTSLPRWHVNCVFLWLNCVRIWGNDCYLVCAYCLCDITLLSGWIIPCARPFICRYQLPLLWSKPVIPAARCYIIFWGWTCVTTRPPKWCKLGLVGR